MNQTEIIKKQSINGSQVVVEAFVASECPWYAERVSNDPGDGHAPQGSGRADVPCGGERGGPSVLEAVHAGAVQADRPPAPPGGLHDAQVAPINPPRIYSRMVGDLYYIRGRGWDRGRGQGRTGGALPSSRRGRRTCPRWRGALPDPHVLGAGAGCRWVGGGCGG